MTLWDMQRNQRSVILEVQSDIPEPFKERLLDLGFHVGESVVCLRRPPFGSPRVYQVGQSVFSLAKDIAHAIKVEVES